jgi:hypothetical protein
MIRVIRTEERSRTIITIDGQLSGDFVGVVETCCTQAESDGKRVHLFLRDVTSVDQRGRMLLSCLAKRGFRLVGSGLYTSYLVHALSSPDVPPQNVPIDAQGDTRVPRRAR